MKNMKKDLRELIKREKGKEFAKETSIMVLELYCVQNGLANEQKEIWERYKKDFPRVDLRVINLVPYDVKERIKKECKKCEGDEGG